jgi:hypothetical protein
MKNSTLYTIIILFCWQVVQAQNNVPLTFSPKVGVNFNDFIISESTVPVLSLARLGWNAGVDVNYGYRLQATGGLHFFRLGTGIETIKDTGNTTERVSTSQFKVPLGVSYRIWQVEYFNLWIQTQLVLNLTTRIVQAQGETESVIYPRSGFGGRFGFGMDLGRFVLELNYERSFNDMLRQTFDTRSQLINASLGIKI